MVKRIAKSLLVTVVLTLALGAATMYYGTQALLEYYRPQLVAEISDAVGCPVSYSKATIKLTSSLEVVLHDVSVMGTKLGFEVIAPHLGAEVNLRGLAQRHLDFDKITLQSPSITLITGASATPTSSAPPTQATQPPQQTSSMSLLPGVAMISIDSGRISRRDSSGHESVILEQLHIESGLAARGAAVTIAPSQASFVIPVGKHTAKQLSFTASLQGLTYSTNPQVLTIQSAQLMTGSSSLAVSGSLDLATGSATASVQGNKVAIASLQQVLSAKALSGTVDVQANVTLSENSLQVTGNFGLSGAKYVASTGESYGVDSLSGPLLVQRATGKGLSVTSQSLAVQGFSYQDPNVTLQHVNGTLSNITGSVGDDTAAAFSVVVHGTGLDLVSGPFVIKKIGSVDSPLTITIPASSGYSVAGPVKAAGVDMTFHGRPFTGALGAVDMLVSNTILRFDTKNITTQSSGAQLGLSGRLEISDSAYTLTNLVGQVAGGSLAATATIQRDPKQQVDAEVLAKGLDIATVKSLWTGDAKAAFSGKIDHLSVKATARKREILSSATGDGVIQITDGTVTHAQFDRRAVGLIKAIPVVGEAVSFTSTATDSSTYEMNGGMLKELTADFTIKAGRIISENIKGQGKFSNLVANGDISFGGEIHMSASAVYLEQNLRSLAGPIRPLGSLLGTIGKIEIPLLIRGSIGDPQISADLSRLQDISSPGRALSPIFKGIESVMDSATGN